MTRITGSGCMLGALCAAFAGSAYLTGQTYFQSAADAAAVMAISGEQAAARSRKNNTGTGTLHSDIIDGIDKMTQEIIQKEIRYELY